MATVTAPVCQVPFLEGNLSSKLLDTVLIGAPIFNLTTVGMANAATRVCSRTNGAWLKDRGPHVDKTTGHGLWFPAVHRGASARHPRSGCFRFAQYAGAAAGNVTTETLSAGAATIASIDAGECRLWTMPRFPMRAASCSCPRPCTA